MPQPTQQTCGNCRFLDDNYKDGEPQDATDTRHKFRIMRILSARFSGIFLKSIKEIGAVNGNLISNPTDQLPILWNRAFSIRSKDFSRLSIKSFP